MGGGAVESFGQSEPGYLADVRDAVSLDPEERVFDGEQIVFLEPLECASRDSDDLVIGQVLEHALDILRLARAGLEIRAPSQPHLPVVVLDLVPGPLAEERHERCIKLLHESTLRSSRVIVGHDDLGRAARRRCKCAGITPRFTRSPSSRPRHARRSAPKLARKEVASKERIDVQKKLNQ